MVRRIGIAAGLLLSLTFIAGAQNPPSSFEVASIKPANSGRPGMSIETETGRFKAINATVSFLIQYAYNIKDFQLSGGPGWMGSDTFDIDARAEKADDRQFPLMMRALLADRFQLKFHQENRTLPVYDLVVAKDGPKFKPAAGTTSAGTRDNSGQITISKGTVANLASLLSNILGRKVIDKTGLTGDYDMTLKWTPDDSSIFTAIQEQLGLKLESSRGPVEVIVVDSVQKPSI